MNKLLLFLFVFGYSYTTYASSPETIENPPIDLFACDEFDNGFTTFDLTINDAIVLGSQNPADFQITYHLSQTDAANGTNPIPNPTAFTSMTATLFVRVGEIANSDVFEVGEFNVIVNSNPELTQDFPFDYLICEEFDGDDSQGEINLNTLASDAGFLAPPQNTSDFLISYYLSATDAQNDAFPIDQSIVLTVNDGDELFFRIQDLLAGCVSFGSIVFAVESQPQINPTGINLNLTVCNDDSDPTGIATFNLTAFEDDITGGDSLLNVMYYASIADLNSGFPIATPQAYTNISNPQTIHILVGSFETPSCSSQGLFDIEVLPLPFVNSSAELITCDFDNDGFASFDLSTLDDVIASGENVTIFYSETEEGALNGDSFLDPSIPFNNTIPFSQTIYARVDSTTSVLPDGTACFVIVEINLVVENCIDTDDDGVPDEEEDLNDNGDLEDDDTDNDNIPNYLDDDDDGDNVMTIDEITGIGAGFTSQDFIDTDDDMIENYLDDDDDGDNVLTIDEDYNDNGSPLDDDTNDNGIPDFLDADVALSADSFSFTKVTVYPNPSSSVMTLENIDLEASIIIYDMLGRTVASFVNEGTTSYTIDISAFPKGMYFMKVDQKQPIPFIKN